MIRLASLFLLLALSFTPSMANGQETPAVGKKPLMAAGAAAPFVVADFVAGSRAGRGGCPFVIVANSRKSGVVFLSLGEGTARAIELAKSLEAAGITGERHFGFVVSCDGESDKLAELAKEAKLSSFDVGIPRGKKLLERLGFAANVDLVAAVVEGKTVRGLRVAAGADEFAKERKAIEADLAAWLSAPKPASN